MVSQITTSPNTINTPENKSNPVVRQNSDAPKLSSQLTRDEIELQKKEKRKKLGVTIATGIAGTGFVVLTLMNGPKGLRDIYKSLGAKAKKLTENNKSLNLVQKTFLTGWNFVKKAKDYGNTILDIATYKDILVKHHISDRIPFLKKMADGLTRVFEKISIKSALISYHNTANSFAKLYSKFEDANVHLSPEKRAELEVTIAKFKEKNNKVFHIPTANDRMLHMNKSLDGFDQQFWNSTLGDFRNYARTKDYSQFQAEALAKGIKTENGKNIIEAADGIKSELAEILELYKTSGLPKEELEKIAKAIKKTAKSMDKSVDIETNKLFDKLRDLKLGSAPTDTLGVISAFGAAGWGLAQADGKDEKISAALEYGIPAVGGVAISLICTVGLISAGPALAIGAISGIGMSKLGEFVDKKRKQWQSTKA